MLHNSMYNGLPSVGPIILSLSSACSWMFECRYIINSVKYGRNVVGKSPGSPEIFSTPLIFGGIYRRGARSQKKRKNIGNIGSDDQEKGKVGLDRYLVRGDRNMVEQKQKQKVISTGEGSNVRGTGR